MKKFMLVAVLAASVAAPAFAADHNMYVAADYGTFQMSDVAPLPNPSAIGVYVGYNFNQNFGVEGNLLVIDDSTFSTITYSQSMYGASGVGTWPINDKFSLYGKVGVAMLKGKFADAFYGTQETTTTNYTYGFGGQYNLTDRVGLRLAYDALGTTKAASSATGATVTRTSVGVVYRF